MPQDIVRALKPPITDTDDSRMSDTSWLKTSPWVERRNGERFTVREPMLTWRPDAHRNSGQQCRFLDVSISGALLLAPIADDLPVDSEVFLALNGELTRVRVSRVEPYNSAFSFYGVEFLELGTHLQQLIDSLTQRRYGTSA